MSFRGRLIQTDQTELYHPWGVATDNIGNIYVADTNNHRIIKYGRNLEPTLVIGLTTGQGDGQFFYPEAVSFGNDVIYVADTANDRVQVFSTAGVFIRKWGKEGSADGDLATPNGIAVNPCTGNVYVTEGLNNRVSVFDANGTFLHKFGSAGTGLNQFQVPIGIAFAPAADGCLFFVSDHYGGRIMVFDTGLPTNGAVATFGTNGMAEGQLSFPDEIAVEERTDDPQSGRVFVAEAGSSRVSVWRPAAGFFQYEFESSFQGGGENGVGYPHGLALDGENNLFVAATNESQVYKYKDLPPKLKADKLSSWRTTKNNGTFLFTVRFNQVDETCQTLGKLTVTVPARDLHVFRLEEDAVVGDQGVDMRFNLSDRQLGWIKHAWNKGRKVTIDGKFVGLCTPGSHKVIYTHTWKA
jgi:DNA-binding beta-propeller fold protein YncE